MSNMFENQPSFIKKEEEMSNSTFNSATEAFAQAQEGDIFEVTFTNPGSRDRNGFTGPDVSQTRLVKEGDYFIEEADLDKKSSTETPIRTEQKRMYTPTDLDNNNKEIKFTKVD